MFILPPDYSGFPFSFWLQLNNALAKKGSVHFHFYGGEDATWVTYDYSHSHFHFNYNHKDWRLWRWQRWPGLVVKTFTLTFFHTQKWQRRWCRWWADGWLMVPLGAARGLHNSPNWHLEAVPASSERILARLVQQARHVQATKGYCYWLVHGEYWLD